MGVLVCIVVWLSRYLLEMFVVEILIVRPQAMFLFLTKKHAILEMFEVLSKIIYNEPFEKNEHFIFIICLN